MSATWTERDNGAAVDGICSICRRGLYYRRVDVEIIRCAGCGEPHLECYCPPALEFA